MTWGVASSGAESQEQAVQFLLDFVDLPRTPAEEAEELEQLRALEHGYRIRCAEIQGWRSVPVDRPEDIVRVEKRLAEGSLGEAPAIYAEAGLWYDALSNLLELISDHPNNESLRTARLELLRQGGLEAVDEALAEHER